VEKGRREKREDYSMTTPFPSFFFLASIFSFSKTERKKEEKERKREKKKRGVLSSIPAPSTDKTEKGGKEKGGRGAGREDSISPQHTTYY